MLKYSRLALQIVPRLISSTLWINRNAKNKKNIPLDKRYDKARKLIIKCMPSFRLDFYVDGLENIPLNTNVLFTPNHQSMLDPVCLIYLLERPMSFLGKKEVKNFPYIGKIFKGIDGLFLDRKNLRQEIKTLGKVSDSLEQKNTWVIFPEGTRTKDSNYTLGEFKAGSIKPAYNAEVPIVPVCIHGTSAALNPKKHEKRYAVQISFLKPHYYEEYKNKSTVEEIQIIQKEIEESLKSKIKREKEEFSFQKIYNKKMQSLQKL